MIAFPCPKCQATLKAPEEKVGARTKCPYCGSPVQVPGRPASAPWYVDDVLPVEVPAQVEDLVKQDKPMNAPSQRAREVERPSEGGREREGDKPSYNIIQRYKQWAGTRSIIFQSILVGWSAFALLATCGLLIPASMKKPQFQEDEDAQASAIGMLSCCSCGGYFLIAFPLGIAAIATLESRKNNRD